MSRTSDLEAKITKAAAEYYNDTPTVADSTYDAWVDELRNLKPDSDVLKSVGAPVATGTGWKKAKHGFVMGSLLKVNTPEEMRFWIATNAPGQTLFVTEKLDGISLHLRYVDGYLEQAITRGDGTQGEDILKNVRRMRGIPHTPVEVEGIPFSGSIRGEIILRKSDHKKHLSEHANPRNAASGVSKRSDGKGCEHLTVMVYKIAASTTHSICTEEEGYKVLKQLFITPSRALFKASEHKDQGPNQMRAAYQASEREKLDYDIDGLVVCIDDVAFQESLGMTDNRPKGAVAFKFDAEGRETVIERFDWQVGGTGRITPVAVVRTVNLCGANITNASVYNLANINKLGLGVGAKVIVVRNNDVIPGISQCIQAPSSVERPPTHCPVCNTATMMDGEYVVCPNTVHCSAQTEGRIKRYLSVLDVLEWGGSLIEKLVAAGLVKTPADLYKLTQNDVASLDRMAEKSAANVLATLHAKKLLPLETLLGALSVPGCGASTFTLLMDSGLDTLEKMRSAKVGDFEKIPGVGPVKANTLGAFFAMFSGIVDELLAEGVKIKPRMTGSLTGKSFCFTGTMARPRKELESFVTAKGGVVKSSAGKGCNYLVIADPSSTSTKAVSARKAGVALITEEEFLAMV